MKVDKVSYTIDKLRSDVCAQYDAELKKNGDEKMREKFLKLRVLEYFFNIASSVAEEKKEEICEAIRLQLSKDDALFGYTCFLASNNQFDYSWNYQRKQWDKYVKILGAISCFLLNFVSGVNLLQSRFDEFKTKKFIFANLFVVSFEEDSHIAETNVLWANLEQIFLVQKGFSISAREEHVLLLSSFCKYNKDNVYKFLEHLSAINVNHSENE